MRNGGGGRPLNSIVRQHFMTIAKRKSVLASLLLVVGAILLGVVPDMTFPFDIAVGVAGALAFGVAFLVAARLKCDECGVRISSRFPFRNPGILLILWAAKDRCRNCGAWL